MQYNSFDTNTWFNIYELLEYLKKTDEDDWLVDKCRETSLKDNKTRNCLIGHIYNYGCSYDPIDGGNFACSIFEECWATSFMYYPVNDGKHLKYQQSSPKERCVKYIEDLISGEEKTTLDCWKDCDEFFKSIKESEKRQF